MMEPEVAPVSAQQAAEALLEVERTQRRSSILRGYEYGAPHFILWGIIWTIGYACSDLLPARAGLIWLALDLIGVSGGLLIFRATPTGATQAANTRRYLAAGATIAAFMAATYFVLAPHSVAQFGAFPALLLAFIYVMTGIWRGSRWTAVGVVLGTLTVLGYGLLGQHFMLWMAVVGGATFLLTGLWMRRA